MQDQRPNLEDLITEEDMREIARVNGCNLYEDEEVDGSGCKCECKCEVPPAPESVVKTREPKKKPSIKDELKKLRIKNFLFLAIAGLINAIGVTMFIAPVNLYDSGISGTSIFLSQVTPLALSFFLIVLNVPLFLFGLKKQGIVFTIYAIYTVAMYSLFAYLIEYVLPIDVSIASPFAEQDLLLCALFGGLISGVGSGLAIRFGGAMDGIEVMAVVLAKKLGITVGTFVMIYNVILYVVAGIVNVVQGMENAWIMPLYSIVTYAIGIKAVDFLVEGLDRAKSAMIITEKGDEVCSALSETFGSGVTIIDAKGYYSQSSKKLVYIVVNRFQITKMKSVVRTEDPKAYIAISEVADVVSNRR